MATPPNVQADVAAERAKYPEDLLTADQCGAICNAVAWKNRALGYGVSGKTSGNYAIRHDGVRISVDILHHQPTDHLIDVLISAGHNDGTKGPANATWIDHGPNTQADRPWVAPIAPPGSGQPASTRLMTTWFCMQRALRDWPDRASSDADYLRTKSSGGVSLVRVMGHVTGGPWVAAAVDVFDPLWWSDFQRMCDHASVRGWQFLFTFFGGHDKVPTLDDKKRVVDHMCAAIRSRRASMRAGELVNEWLVNGWTRSDVRELVRHAAGQVDGLPLAASSPNLAHNGGASMTYAQLLADARALYDGLPCGLMTWHRSRDQSSPWNDIRNCKPVADALGLPLWDSEPYGPGSSVSSVDDPSILSRDYLRAEEAGCEAEDLHTGWGVFNGEVDDEAYPGADMTKSIQDHTNIDQILASLGEIALTGSTSGGGSGGGEPGGGGEEPMIPYDEAKSIEFGHACNDVYAEAGAPQDPGMVSVHSSRAAWDYYVGGLPWPESKRKHINEFRAVYGLPPV